MTHTNHASRAPCRDANRRHGMSLIELLIVVAIVALLLAILLPSLEKARTMTQRLVCKANLKQIAGGLQAYSQANNDGFLRGPNAHLLYGGWRGTSWGSTPRATNRPLNQHLGLPKSVTKKTARVFKCPADRGGRPTPLPTAYGYFGTSYQTNRLLIGPDQMGLPLASHQSLVEQINAKLPELKATNLADPSRLLLVGDYGWVNQWLPRSKRRAEWHKEPYTYNLAFADSHVDFVRIRKGLYIAPKYRILPCTNESVNRLAAAIQREVPND